MTIAARTTGVRRVIRMVMKRPAGAAGSELLVEDLAELVADVDDLGLVELGVQEVEDVLLALEADLPDLAAVVVAGGLVDDQALAHQDQAEDEAEVELGGFGDVGEALEELGEDVV